MYYVIEAVRWGPDGHLSHVRWREVDTDGDVIVRSAPREIPVVHAADACRDREVRVYVPGPAGRFFRMRACDTGIEAVADDRGTPLRERLAHLPQF